MSYRPKTTYKWIVESDACDKCQDMEGSYDEFPKSFPLHPNCRCTIEKIEPDKTTILDPDELHLTGSLASDSSSNPEDVIAVKRHLIDAGNYEFDKKIGEDWDSMANFPTPRFIDGLKQYQSEHGLMVDGKMKSGGETENMMRYEDGEKQQEKEAKKMMKEEKLAAPNDRFNSFVNRTLQPGMEGRGYEDNLAIIDQPTHSGITQPILDAYIRKYPNKKISNNLEDLSEKDMNIMYKDFFYDEKKIDQIENDRIAFAVFDMGVMTSPRNVAKTIQNTLNKEGIATDVDGIIGKETIKSLNSVKNIDSFMNILKKNRKEYLNGLSESQKYPGWQKRTDTY